MPTDNELLRDYSRTGSQAAFAELVRRHVDFLYATALRVVNGDHHLAEDVTQATFAQFARQAGRLETHPVLRGWLHTTAYHLAVRAVRTERRRIAREEQVATMNEDCMDSGPDWTMLRPVLDETLQELAEADRESILLRYGGGKRFAELGAQLGVGENAARMRVERALDRLRGLLARRGITSPVAALGLVLEQQAAAVAAPAGLAARIAGAAGGSAGTAALAGWGLAKLALAGFGLAAAAAIVVAVAPPRTESVAPTPPRSMPEVQAPGVTVAQPCAATGTAEPVEERNGRSRVVAGRVAQRVVAPAPPAENQDQLPRLITEPELALAEAFGSAAFSGRIVVGFEVDDQGAVLDPYIVDSAAPELDAAALAAAATLQFTGGRKDGRSVTTRMSLLLHLGPGHGPPEVGPLLP